MKDDYRELLKKYIAHVVAAEGYEFVLGFDLAPCVEGKWSLASCVTDELEFNTADKLRLEDLFQEIREER